MVSQHSYIPEMDPDYSDAPDANAALPPLTKHQQEVADYVNARYGQPQPVQQPAQQALQPSQPEPESQPAPTDSGPPEPISNVMSPNAPPGQVLPAAPQYLPVGAPGSIRATPQQATAEGLNLNARSQGLVGQGGDILGQEAQAIGGVLHDKAAEQEHQASDHAHFLTDAYKRLDSARAQAQSAYDKYREEAGRHKDPGAQFWADKGEVGGPLAHIGGAFAAFASGLGAGLAGQGGNPFLSYLNDRIKQNFEAHKQNIEELYQQQVAAGKIVDNVQNRNQFMDRAKMAHYDLATKHYDTQIEDIKNNSQSQLVKVKAQQAQNDLKQAALGMRQALSTQEAAQAAAQLAQARAREKEVRVAIAEARKGLDAAVSAGNMSPAEADAAAVQTVANTSGYNQSDLAQVMKTLGIKYNEKTGYDFPKPEATTKGPGVSFDENGEPIVSDFDLTGRRLGFKEKEELAKDAKERTVTLDDGSKALAINKEDAKYWAVESAAIATAKKLLPELKAASDNHDVGTYHAKVGDLKEAISTAYGFRRVQNGNESSLSSGGAPGEVPGYPSWWKAPGDWIAYGSNPGTLTEAGLATMEKDLDTHKVEREQRLLVHPSRAAKPAPKPAPKALDFIPNPVQPEPKAKSGDPWSAVTE